MILAAVFSEVHHIAIAIAVANVQLKYVNGYKMCHCAVDKVDYKLSCRIKWIDEKCQRARNERVDMDCKGNMLVGTLPLLSLNK